VRLPSIDKARLAALGTLASVTLLSGLSWAQGVDEFGPYGYDPESLQSPQHWALELRLGPYSPNVDDEFGGSATPFGTAFHDAKPWSFGFEADWQALKIPKFGTLGPGVGWGFVSMKGKARFNDGAVADDDIRFRIMPMYLVAVLRVDAVAKYTPVPVVPYGKFGLGHAMWWGDDGYETLTAADGSKARDTSTGTQWAVGLMLLLDVFDRRAAASLDATSGVNNSYVFFELYNSALNGLGQTDMHVGTNTWQTGIAIEL